MSDIHDCGVEHPPGMPRDRQGCFGALKATVARLTEERDAAIRASGKKAARFATIMDLLIQRAGPGPEDGEGLVTCLTRVLDERDAARVARVAGAVQVHAAREAFVAFRDAVEGVAPELPQAAFDRLLEALERANAALSRLDGGGDVREWAAALAMRGADLHNVQLITLLGEVDASLASPPALPDAAEALAEAFAWVLSGDTPQPQATALRLARRWLGGER